jgi:cysteinyl-tRNA synthetase
VEKLGKLQEKLLTFSTFGKQVKNQSDEFQSAVKTIEEIGKDLTREKLLDLFIQAPSETRLSVLVSLTRPGLDYEFYQILSEKIDRARAEERDKLLALREKLLSITESIDQAVEARVNRARETLNQVLATSNPAEALQNSDATIDDFFLQALSEELEKARKAGDLERIDKIRQIDSMLQQAMKPSREVELVQRFLGFEAESEQEKFLEENRQGITPEFMETLSAMMAQLQAGGENPELVAHVENAYRTALRFSMKMNL